MSDSAVTAYQQENVFVEQPQGEGSPTVIWDRVILSEQLNAWQKHVLREINSIAALPVNWDGAGSPPPTPQAIQTAVDHILYLYEWCELPTPYIAPVSGGGIQFVWVSERRKLDWEALPDGTIEYLVSQDGTPSYEGQAQASDFPLAKSLVAWVVENR